MALRALTLALASTALCFAVVSCSAPPPPPFESEGFEWALDDGEGGLEGDLFARTRGGDVRSGAGFTVYVAPHHPHFVEAWLHPEGGSGYAHGIEASAEPYVRTAQCDGQGQWRIEGLPPGEYVVHGTVRWEVPRQYGTSYQLGNAIRIVTLAEGETKTVSLKAD